MKLTEEQVRKIAHLSRIKVTEKDLFRFSKSITKVLDWVEMLNEVDTDNVEPMFSVNLDRMPMRQDVINDGGKHYDILSNAPEEKHNMFVVPKVVE